MCRTRDGSSTSTSVRWATRLIPFFLLGCAVFGLVVVVKLVSVDFFLKTQRNVGVAVVLILLCSILFALGLATYLRLFITATYDPGLLPRGSTGARVRQTKTSHADQPQGLSPDVEAPRYDTRLDLAPGFPDLKMFYRKNAFVCNEDGMPRWCTSCRTWKLDRVHHNSDINRCVKKLDHFCPWVGGIISETTFKYFIQFVYYATLYCLVVLIATALGLRGLTLNGSPTSGAMIAAVVLSGFLGIFTISMALISTQYAFTNLTNIDDIQRKDRAYYVAIRVPRDTPTNEKVKIVTYPPLQPEPPRPPRPSRHRSGISYGKDDSVVEGGLERLPSERMPSPETHTFAIVRAEKGENPWDLGFCTNWVSVMGPHVWDWFLPLRRSPVIAQEESTESFYPMGPFVAKLQHRYKLPDLNATIAIGGDQSAPGRD